MKTTKAALAQIINNIANNGENTSDVREKALQISAVLRGDADIEYITKNCHEHETINTCTVFELSEQKTATDGRIYAKCVCGASGFIRESETDRRSANHKNHTYKYNNGRCEICQRLESETNGFVLHHIIPYKLGGDSSIYNIQIVCHECHKTIHEQRNTLNTDRNYSEPIGGKFNNRGIS